MTYDLSFRARTPLCLLLLLGALMAAGCAPPRPQGGDDDDATGSLEVDTDLVSIPALNGVYIEVPFGETTQRQIYATQGLTCADYQEFWGEAVAAGSDLDAVREAYLGLPGVPGWTVLIEVLGAEEPPVGGEFEDGYARATLSELTDEVDESDPMIQIDGQLGMGAPLSRFDAFGAVVEGELSGEGAYTPEFPEDSELTFGQTEITFRVEPCALDVE